MEGHVTLRLPLDAKAFVQAEARMNGSSQNSEIIRAIRERMRRKGAMGAEMTTAAGVEFGDLP